MCSCRSKLSGMRKSKNMQVVTTGVKVAAGFIGGRFIANVDFLKTNPYLGIGAQAAGAIVLNGMKGGNFKEAALGMAASAVIDTIRTVAPSAATQLGLSASLGGIDLVNAGGASSSYAMPGVAGKYKNEYADMVILD